MAERTYRWLLITLAVLGFAADQASKYGVFRWLYNDGNFADLSGNSREVVPGWFRLIAQFDTQAATCGCWYEPLQTWSAPTLPRVNHGALFGMGQEKKGTANGFFAAVSVFAAFAILAWGMRHSIAREKWLMIALGLILGGTLGNLYDRLVFNGVRDFMYFYYIEWPVFNFADCLLVVGAGVLLIQAIFAPHPADAPAATVEQPSIPEAAKG